MGKPAALTEEHEKFLADLRDSGATNMYGAGAYLQQEFGLSRADANAVLGQWMEKLTKQEG